MEQDFLKAYNEFGDAIFRYCFLQTSNRETALDLTQDTFTRTWQYLSKGKTVENIKAFLYRVATNLIIDYRRKKKPTISLESLMAEGFDVGDEFNLKEKKAAVFEAEKAVLELQKIDEKYRTVLTMRYINDLSLKEIADITGESQNNISVRVHRGLEKIRKILENNGELTN